MTRIPGLTWRPGPSGKQGYSDGAANSLAGLVLHSAEGYAAGMFAVLDNPLGTSWCGSVMKDGSAFQHYELEAVTWHGGNRYANERFAGFEFEGVTGEPLTPPQVAKAIAISQFVADIPTAWPLAREPYAARTLWEHNEVVLLATPNAGPTSCPNSRIPWDVILAGGNVPDLPVNTNITPGPWDIGLTRTAILQSTETLAREFRRSAGSVDDLIAAVRKGFA